jgi:hypothetical protein
MTDKQRLAFMHNEGVLAREAFEVQTTAAAVRVAGRWLAATERALGALTAATADTPAQLLTDYCEAARAAARAFIASPHTVGAQTVADRKAAKKKRV